MPCLVVFCSDDLKKVNWSKCNNRVTSSLGTISAYGYTYQAVESSKTHVASLPLACAQGE